MLFAPEGCKQLLPYPPPPRHCLRTHTHTHTHAHTLWRWTWGKRGRTAQLSLCGSESQVWKRYSPPQHGVSSAKAGPLSQRGSSPGLCRNLSKDLSLSQDTSVDFAGSPPRSEEHGTAAGVTTPPSVPTNKGFPTMQDFWCQSWETSWAHREGLLTPDSQHPGRTGHTGC